MQIQLPDGCEIALGSVMAIVISGWVVNSLNAEFQSKESGEERPSLTRMKLNSSTPLRKD